MCAAFKATAEKVAAYGSTASVLMDCKADLFFLTAMPQYNNKKRDFIHDGNGTKTDLPRRDLFLLSVVSHLLL